MYKHVEQALSSRLRLPARPRLRRRRGQDRDRRRIDGPTNGRPQMAGRPAPGGRSEGTRADHRRHRPGRAGHRADLFPPVRARVRHDGHGRPGSPRAAQPPTRSASRRFRPIVPAFARGPRTAFLPRSNTNAGRSSQEVARMHAAGRAVLVGTPSVDASEALGRALERAAGIRTRDSERPLPRERSRDRRPGRRDLRRHHRHQHGRPRHRHPARRGRPRERADCT